jgi:hypothetical protein
MFGTAITLLNLKLEPATARETDALAVMKSCDAAVERWVLDRAQKGQT